uniref:Lipid-binding serum glycoprotein N-terminal domain-containing protein n=1 Tax=Clastoptera arizonana TaxID=38151 RepID=A0A1B6DLS9_9HEMI
MDSMKVLCITFICAQLTSVSGELGVSHNFTTHRVNQLSDQIRLILEHYKNPDPVGIPGIPIADSIKINDIKKQLTFAKLEMQNVRVHGLSKFKIDSFYSDIADMKVEIVVYIEKLEVLGNYTLNPTFWPSKTRGNCNITLSDVFIQGLAKLEIALLGNLEATDIDMDIVVDNIALDFQNLGFFASMFQKTINTIGPFILESIKPLIMQEVNNDIRQKINTNFKKLNTTLSNSISPLDMAIYEGRKFVRKNGYDPLALDSFNFNAGIFSLEITSIWIKGLASFYRVGNITVKMENNTLHFVLDIGTQELKGNCEWKCSTVTILSKSGEMSFTLEYLNVKAKINQSLDIRKKPILDDLIIDIGNIQLLCDGAGTFDYILEAIVNILPNILRYQIMMAVEEPLQKKIQEILNSYDMESKIEQSLSELNNFQTIKNIN